MNRICKTIDGKLIEIQSGGFLPEHLDTLKQNAIRAGYAEDLIEVRWVSDEEFKRTLDEITQPTAEQKAEAEKEALIQAKMRELAVAELVAEGKLDREGQIRGGI
jgi:hypothetical protein